MSGLSTGLGVVTCNVSGRKVVVPIFVSVLSSVEI